MNCRRARKLLMDKLATGLAPTERDALEGHLSTCQACRAEAEGLGETWQALGSLEFSSPPPMVKAELFQAIEAEREKENRVLLALRRLLPASLAAGLASVAFALLFPYQAMAELCYAWLSPLLGKSAWPINPFFLLIGVVYSAMPLCLACGLLSDRVVPSPARSAALVGGVFLLVVLPYVVWECRSLDATARAGLVTGFVTGTLACTAVQCQFWRVRLEKVLARAR